MTVRTIDRRRALLTSGVVFSAALLVNVLSANPGQVPVRAPDTVGYLDVTRQILRGELPYLHARTPGYPLFLALAELTGSWERIVWIQAIVGAVAAVALWWMLRVYIRSLPGSALAAVGLMAAYDVSSWHGYALTESLSLSFVILWAFAHLAALDALPRLPLSARAWRVIAIALDVTLMMLRPTFFFLPAAWYATALAYRLVARRSGSYGQSARALDARALVLGLAVSVLVIVAWCGMIRVRYGRFEMSILTRFARLGNLMTLGFASADACSRRPCSPLLRRGVELASNDTLRVQGPFAVIARLEAEYPGVPRGAMLDSLNRALTPTPQILVRLRALRRAAYILAQRNWYNNDGVLWRVRLYRAYSKLILMTGQWIAYPAALWAGAYAVLALAVARRVDWVRVLLLFVVVYTSAVNVLAGYEGWDRLMVPVVVPLNVLALLLVRDLVLGTATRLRSVEADPGART